MTLTAREALELEVSIYADEFKGDFDRLLRHLDARLVLRWDGGRNTGLATLLVHFAGAARPEPLAQYTLGHPTSRWVATGPRAADFRERFQGLLKLHRAELGLGISPVHGVARMNIGFPRAPRMDPTETPLSLRVLATRRGQQSGYVPPPLEASP